MPSIAASLSVNRQHLLQALRHIKTLTGIGRQPAVISHTDGELQIALGGCSFRAEAEGNWDGQVKVPVSFIKKLAKAPPEGDGQICISTDGESLRVGFVVTKCKWDRLVYPRVELPLGASLLDKLAIGSECSKDDIKRSDLSRSVKTAEAKRDELIQKAAHILQPLGIKESDVRRLVDESLQRSRGGEPTSKS